jgi:hypothetical protein
VHDWKNPEYQTGLATAAISGLPLPRDTTTRTRCMVESGDIFYLNTMSRHKEIFSLGDSILTSAHNVKHFIHTAVLDGTLELSGIMETMRAAKFPFFGAFEDVCKALSDTMTISRMVAMDTVFVKCLQLR